ncbi:armadillo-type protein [Mycena rebaudengoi]|nr:armadillo-type protein [Mycena rebaudengoi]
MNATDLLTNTLSAGACAVSPIRARSSRLSLIMPEYMLMLSSVVVDEARQLYIRNAAGLALKNALRRRPPDRLLGLLDGPRRGRQGQDQAVAAIAAFELPLGQWGELIEMLLGFANTQANVNLRITTLQTIGFICESIKPEILTLRSNEILTAVIHGARKEELSPEVQLAAIHALFNSLEFVRDNFEREGERNYIMQVVCEATQNASVNIQVGAVRVPGITEMYYDKMGFYMEQALFGLTVVGMKHTDELVALRAVELWSTVCEEMELAIKAQEVQEYGEAPERESKCFAKITLPEIVSVLLLLLTKQGEDANDDEELNVSMLLACAVQDAVVPAVIPFIEAHIKATDWHQREAAVLTFGSILEGPDPIVLTPLVTQALPLLIDMMTDVNAHVRDTTAWTLGRICDLLIQTIKPDVHLHPLASALLGAFDSEQAEPVQSGPLSPYYEGVVATLLRVTESAGNGANFRTAAYEAIAAYLGGATLDAITVVQNAVLTILQRMEQLLAMQNQIVGVDDRNNWNELQGNFCNLVIWAIQKLLCSCVAGEGDYLAGFSPER